MDKQREKLIELIHSADLAFVAKGIEMIENAMNEDLIDKIISRQEFIADHLIANGVIVPPMKLGLTCFEPCEWRNEVDECRVSSITQKADGSLKIRITNLHYRSAYEITTDDIGKTVFLSREDAEKALKGVE